MSSESDASSPRPPAAPVDIAGAPVNAFAMNQYILACTSTKQAAIIDCGASSQSELDPFLSWMKERSYRLVKILQTHAHLDHVAGLNFLRKIHPDVPIYLHERDMKIYARFEDSISGWNFELDEEGRGPLPTDNLHYFDDAKSEVSVGELSLQIIPTPGHCPGHVGYYEPKANVFFGGDLIMKGSIGRTDFPESSSEDMMESLKKVVGMDEDMLIYPGHGPATTMKDEKTHNPFLQGM